MISFFPHWPPPPDTPLPQAFTILLSVSIGYAFYRLSKMMHPICFLLGLKHYPDLQVISGSGFIPLCLTPLWLKGSAVTEGAAADQGCALLLQMQHPRSTVMLSPPPHVLDLQLLQQQACPVVPREQFLQLQHQLLQAERISQRLQEEPENRTSETNTPQVGGFSPFVRNSDASFNCTCLLEVMPVERWR